MVKEIFFRKIQKHHENSKNSKMFGRLRDRLGDVRGSFSDRFGTFFEKLETQKVDFFNRLQGLLLLLLRGKKKLIFWRFPPRSELPEREKNETIFLEVSASLGISRTRKKRCVCVYTYIYILSQRKPPRCEDNSCFHLSFFARWWLAIFAIQLLSSEGGGAIFFHILYNLCFRCLFFLQASCTCVCIHAKLYWQ